MIYITLVLTLCLPAWPETGTIGMPGKAPGDEAVGQSRRRMIVAPSAGDLNGDFDHHGRAARKLRDAHGGTRVATRVTEYGKEELAGPVDDAGLAGESLRRRDEADNLHHPHDLVQADRVVDRGKRREGALTAQFGGPLRRHVTADLACRGQLTVGHWRLTGHEDEIS